MISTSRQTICLAFADLTWDSPNAPYHTYGSSKMFSMFAMTAGVDESGIWQRWFRRYRCRVSEARHEYEVRPSADWPDSSSVSGRESRDLSGDAHPALDSSKSSTSGIPCGSRRSPFLASRFSMRNVSPSTTEITNSKTIANGFHHVHAPDVQSRRGGANCSTDGSSWYRADFSELENNHVRCNGNWQESSNQESAAQSYQPHKGCERGSHLPIAVTPNYKE